MGWRQQSFLNWAQDKESWELGFTPVPNTHLLSDTGQAISPFVFLLEGNNLLPSPQKDVVKINLEYLEQVGQKQNTFKYMDSEEELTCKLYI